MDKIKENIAFSSGLFEKEKKFWKETLTDDIPFATFIQNHDAISYNNSNIKKEVMLDVPEKIYSGISKMANGSDYGIYVVLLSGICSILSRFSGYNDIIIGSPIFKQDCKKELFNYILPLRMQLSNNMTVKKILFLIMNVINNANKNMNYPFSKISEIKNNQNLFDVFVRLDSIHCDLNLCNPRCNFIFDFYPANSKMKCKFSYNQEIIEQNEVLNIINCLLKYYECILENTDIELNHIDLISAEDKQKMLFEFNDTYIKYPNNITIADIFETQVKKTPNAKALTFSGTTISYNELNKCSNQVARLLMEKGVHKDCIIGVLVDRSIEMIMAIMAILKAGGCYLPIDPAFPANRINFMLTNSKTRFVLTQKKHQKIVPDNVITIDIMDKNIYNGESCNITNVNRNQSDLAYLLYTSGSTGLPKGVMIEQKGLCNFLLGISQYIDFNQVSKILSLTTISFDIFCLESIIPLCRGMEVIIATENEQKDPKRIRQIIAENRVDMLQATPTRMRMILCDSKKEDFLSVKTLIVGGEVLPESLLREIKEKFSCKILNSYGPTEATIYCTTGNVSDCRRVHIGKPMANTQIYILDDQGQLCPIGVPGEICIGGDCLARGYLYSPELTEKKFVDCSYAPGNKIYRSGDLARWMPDGRLECLGRLDHQVKIRGYRIELGEIENQMLKINDIIFAAVIDRENKYGEKNLYAYYVANKPLSQQIIREKLLKVLPTYMVPTYFTQLDKIPTTPNGKLDRKSLPEPTENYICMEGYEAPTNEIEEKLAEIWSDVLSVPKVSINKHFFDLGGDSLKAIRVISRINKLGYNVNVNILYSSSLKDIAKLLKNMKPCTAAYKNFEDVNKMLKNKLETECLLVERKVSNCTFNVLYISQTDKPNYHSIYEFFRNNCTKNLWPHYFVLASDLNDISHFQELDENEFASLCSLKKESDQQFIGKILANLEEEEALYEQSIIGREVINTFPCNGIQKGVAQLDNHIAGDIIQIDYFGSKNEIFTALYNIVYEQELLRSVLSQSKKGFWKEFSMPDKINIPYVDLSCYSLNTKKRILKTIIMKKYFKVYFGYEKLLYRFILVKENLREFKLIAPFDHIIFDATSVEIIRQNLNRYLYKGADSVKKNEDFKNYISQMMRGPFQFTPKSLIESFKLKEYQQYTQKVEKHILQNFKNQIHSMTFKINIGDSNELVRLKRKSIKEEKIWEVSFYFSVLLSKWIFNLDKIPFKLFYYGREYLNCNFHNTIGFFTDILPVLITVNENSMDDMAAQVQNNIEIVKKYNINFACLDQYDHLNTQWREALSYLKPQNLGTDNLIILYNFQGKKEINDGLKQYNDLSTKYLDRFRIEGANLSIVSFYTDDFLFIKVLSDFEINQADIQKKFDDRLKNIISSPEDFM